MERKNIISSPHFMRLIYAAEIYGRGLSFYRWQYGSILINV